MNLIGENILPAGHDMNNQRIEKEVNMWLAVIIFVSLSVEVLSYLTGGDSCENASRKAIRQK